MRKIRPTFWGGPNPEAPSNSPSAKGSPTARSETPSPLTSPTPAPANPKTVVEFSGTGLIRVGALTGVTKKSRSAATPNSAPCLEMETSLLGEKMVEFIVLILGEVRSDFGLNLTDRSGFYQNDTLNARLIFN